MSPRHALLAVPLALAVGLGGSGAAAMVPADPTMPARMTAQPSVALGKLPASSVVGDGPVTDVVQLGDTVYALGTFGEIGRYTGPGRILDSATGADLPAPTFGDGQVSVVLADGAGGWYVAGDVRRGVVHVLADGTIDPAFAVKVDGLVSAIARDGDTLYLGGLFDHVHDANRENLAAVSATSGAVLPFSSDYPARVTELVYAPAADGVPATLYVGGDGVAGLDPVDGDMRMWSGGFDGDVRALALGDGVVYVGTHDLEAIDAVSGMPVHSFDPDVSSSVVHSLLLDGDRLYVGSDGGTERLVAVDPETGATDPTFDPQVSGGKATWGEPGGVFDLALDGDRLWVAGAFAEAGGDPAGGLAVLDAATGAATDVGVPRLHEQVNAVELSGGAAYVGGHFYLDDPLRTRGLAALDADTLEPRRGFRVHGPFRPGELTVAPNAVYVAPTHFLGYSPYRSEPPYFDDTTWTVHAYDPDTGAVDDARTHRIEDLTGITTLGGSLMVAQRLQDDVRFPRNRITVYAPNGTPARSFRVPLPGYITEMGTIDGDLLLAGSFRRTSPAGAPRNTALIRIDARTGTRRAYFDPRIHGPVNDISVWGDSIYASGLFHAVHQGLDQKRPGLTKLDARSVKSETFAPQVRGGRDPYQRATAVGDVVWTDTYPQRFLDAETGERVHPVGSLDDWLRAVTGDAGTLVVGSDEWTSLAGQGALQIGYVIAFPL